MRTGFTLKEAGQILGVHERRVTQALDPAIEKFGKLWNADPSKTMALLLEAAEALKSATGLRSSSASSCTRC